MIGLFQKRPMTKDDLEARRSGVRVFVTRIATIYVFGGSAVLIAALWFWDAKDNTNARMAKDLFMAVLPVATGVVTYWFASRRPKNMSLNEEPGENISVDSPEQSD